jgi:hypothetical protein
MPGHAHRGTGSEPSSLQGYAVTPKVEFRGSGHRCENLLCPWSGRAVRCVVSPPIYAPRRRS